MADFSCALTYTLFNEGSAYVNNPDDRGGPTRYGVTLQALSKYLKRRATADDIRNLTVAAVRPLYLQNYWIPAGCASIGLQSVATMAFDCAVLCGVGRSVSMVSGASRAAGLAPSRLDADMPASRRRVLEREFCLEWQRYLINVALAGRRQTVWLDGWVRRVHRAWRLLSLQHRELAVASQAYRFAWRP